MVIDVTVSGVHTSQAYQQQAELHYGAVPPLLPCNTPLQVILCLASVLCYNVTQLLRESLVAVVTPSQVPATQAYQQQAEFHDGAVPPLLQCSTRSPNPGFPF